MADGVGFEPPRGFAALFFAKICGFDPGKAVEMMVADGVGFEPTVGFHLRRFSRPLP